MRNRLPASGIEVATARSVEQTTMSSHEYFFDRAGDAAPKNPWQGTERALERWDYDDVAGLYRAQDEMIVLDHAIAPDGVTMLARAAERLRVCAVRKAVPGYKKSGSVSARDVRAIAPEIIALYESPALVGALSRIAGVTLLPCPERDLHATALYYYTEAGDGIGWHFDSSHYKGGRYTVLIGIVNRTEQSRLLCTLNKKEPAKPQTELSVATDPGTLVFFNGDRLWHSVSKLGEGEERIVLTLEYVTDTRMNPVRRWISDFKDAATYFGFTRKKR
jgi:hypothetical protein